MRHGLDLSWIDKHRLFSQLSAVPGLPLPGLAAGAGPGTLGPLGLDGVACWCWSGYSSGLVWESTRVIDKWPEPGLPAADPLRRPGRWPQRLPGLAALGVVGLFLVASLAVGTEGFIGPLRRVDLFHALLTPGLPALLAWLLLTLRAPGEEIPVRLL